MFLDRMPSPALVPPSPPLSFPSAVAAGPDRSLYEPYLCILVMSFLITSCDQLSCRVCCSTLIILHIHLSHPAGLYKASAKR